MKTIQFDETKYKLVPLEPTDAMEEAAHEGFMPFGDMKLAIQLAINAAPTAEEAQHEHVEWVEVEPNVRGMRLRDILNPRFPAAIGTVMWHTKKPLTNNPVFEVRQL